MQLGLKGFFIASISFNTGYTGNKGSRIRKTVLLASEVSSEDSYYLGTRECGGAPCILGCGV